MHIGRQETLCEKLKIEKFDMEIVESDTYLGDVISNDGRNSRNIDSRVSKGLGIVTHIFDVLKHVSFGRHFFTVALLLRDMMLVNGILTNGEIWFGLTPLELKKLEEVDKIFMRRLFRVPKSCPAEVFYLETGSIPISYKIKAKRVNYLHHLVTRDESELISKIFKVQWENPLKNDWVVHVKDDLSDLGLTADLDWIKSIKKYKFKEMIKDKVRAAAFKALMKQKEGHSKLRNLSYLKLEAQPYLINMDITTNQARIIFKSRTRMLCYWQNFKGDKEIQICQICCEEGTVDSHEHCLNCKVVSKSLKVEVRYSDIFNAVTKSLAKSLERIEDFREIFLKWNQINKTTSHSITGASS